jgi:hypothetical protein
LRAGGLDRWHRTNKRDAELRAQFSERERRGGIAGDDNQIGFVFVDRSTEHIDNALDQSVFIQVPVGKAGVVRQIDVTRVRASRLDFAENRQAAEA